MEGKVERLHAAGVIKTVPLPDRYMSVVEQLTDEEVDALVSAKRRLDSVIEVEAHGQDDPPPPEDFFLL